MKEKDVLHQLQVLEPTASDAPRPAAQALARVKGEIERQEANRLHRRFGRFWLAPQRRTAVAAIFALFLLIFAFSFPAVRAAASDFLGLFRVQKFAAISISPEQIAILQQVAEQGLMPGEVEIVNEPGELQQVGSLNEAAANTGLAGIKTVPGLGEPQEIYVADGGDGRFHVNLEGARAIVQAAGADPLLLPESLDGAVVNVVVFPGVQQVWDNGVTLMETPSPVVQYPEDVDPTVLGEALLQLLGMNPAEAARLAQNIDWTSTLLLPIPQDFASFNEVTVNGVSGLALNAAGGEGSALFWQKADVVYLLVGQDMAAADLVELANSIE